METKFFEVRDRATFIPAMATRFAVGSERELYLLRRVGYDPTDAHVLLVRLSDTESHVDPYEWTGSARTMPTAHRWIVDNWAHLKSGDVVDVEFILGESKEPKRSEMGEEEL